VIVIAVKKNGSADRVSAEPFLDYRNRYVVLLNPLPTPSPGITVEEKKREASI
jgi:hypothetical protein